eukprot:GABV01000642.1.p2 GENE.GABV01000642.1~~GABV01000642.1.p2  ORF type:complete len:190 (-),score=72.74 GABV01000642.1:220-789(-)
MSMGATDANEGDDADEIRAAKRRKTDKKVQKIKDRLEQKASEHAEELRGSKSKRKQQGEQVYTRGQLRMEYERVKAEMIGQKMVADIERAQAARDIAAAEAAAAQPVKSAVERQRESFLKEKNPRKTPKRRFGSIKRVCQTTSIPKNTHIDSKHRRRRRRKRTAERSGACCCCCCRPRAQRHTEHRHER